MGTSNKIMSFKQPTIKQQVHFNKLFDKCQELTLNHIKKILRRMFDHADDALFALAEKTDATNDSTAYFDSMRIIRLKRSEIENQHFDFIKKAFADIKNNTATNHSEERSLDSLNIDDLSLIEEADLEENIAIKNIVSKVSHHCAQDLSHIEKRLSHILGNEVNAQNNPLGPNVICSSFMQAATALDIELKVSLIILKLFDQEIVSGLTPLLNEANNLFITANVLPEFKHTIQKSEHIDSPYQSENSELGNSQAEQYSHAQQQGSFAQPTSGMPIGANSNGGYQDTSIAHFHELLNQQHITTNIAGNMQANTGVQANNVHPIMPSQPSSGMMAGMAAGITPNFSAEGATVGSSGLEGFANANVVSSPQFVGSLTQLQNIPLATMLPTATTSINADGEEVIVPPSDAGLHPSGNLKQFVIQQLRQQDENFSVNNISPLDQDVIDVVSLLFDFILEDKNIPNAAKAHIARLQIPLLKAAIIDKEFFSANNNSARNLLNALAHAALGIVDEDEDSSKKLISEIERIVDAINNEFEDDLSLFDTQLENFKAFMAQHEQQEATINNKIQRKSKRKEDNALAYQWVEDTVEEILQGKHLPDNVIDLIRGPWKKVMLNTYLNNGQDSDTWKNQVRFIDVLEWSIQPKHETLSRQKLANIIGQLVLTLRNGLQVIQVSAEETQEILTQLEPFHFASIKGLSVKEYLATLKPDESFLFASTSDDAEENQENIPELTADDRHNLQVEPTVANDSEDGSKNISPNLSPTEIALEEIDYEADENYETNLSLDEIDQTILKMEQELQGLEELTNSISAANADNAEMQASRAQSTEDQPANEPLPEEQPNEDLSAEALMQDDFVLLGNEEAMDDNEDCFSKLITEDIILSGFSSEQASSPEDQPQDEYLELARHLEQGKWVEFIDDSNHKTRAKLAWKSELLGEYTFLNWKFDVVADKTLYGLAADLRRGSAMIIDDIPLVDRALSAVMSSLTPTGEKSHSSSTS